ncbi:MAG TPA: class I SAM-dependent methyltransferase [Lacipirellulaceae bacterium]|nr:class I SAM-dependent methyltransferase [Lacipirellulaceae bacterium]
MNKLLLCAYHLQKLRPTQGAIDLHILTDEPEKFPDSECRRMLAPWANWVRIVPRQPLDAIDIGAIRKLQLRSGETVIAIFKDQSLQKEVQARCEKSGATSIVPHFPPAGTLDSDLLREVSFFDFEIGGKNEWDGAPTRYAAHCLRQLSSTHTKDSYPAWAFETLLRAPGGRQQPLKVMDIGCGPVSVLRWGAIQGEISITGVDPNLDMYALVLARHGLDALPKIRCDRDINGFAEDLNTLIPDDDFDVIYTQNALDHTQQPARVIKNMARKLAPHGLAVIQVATREGTRQKWDQLHKTDIYLKNGALMYAHQHEPERQLLSPESRLRLKHVQTNTPEWLACVLEKRSATFAQSSRKRWRLPGFSLQRRKVG